MIFRGQYGDLESSWIWANRSYNKVPRLLSEELKSLIILPPSLPPSLLPSPKPPGKNGEDTICGEDTISSVAMLQGRAINQLDGARTNVDDRMMLVRQPSRDRVMN